MKIFTAFIFLFMSSISMASSEKIRIFCIFEKENHTQIHRIFNLETKSDGKDAIFFSISPDFTRIVEVKNNDDDLLNEITRGDIAFTIIAIDSVTISMAIGSVLETFTPINLGEVITIEKTPSPVRVDYTATSSGQLKLKMSILKNNAKASCQITRSSWLNSLIP